MKRDDYADFREHPEWFYVEPIQVFLKPNEMLKEINPAAYDEAMHLYVNPPVVIRRKPVPVVLPIKGSAL